MNIFRFKQLELYSGNLHGQKQFYLDLLQLPLVEEDARSFSCLIGSSVLKFLEGESGSRCHFAINIPANQIRESFDWLNPQVEKIKDGLSDFVRFEGWNANALYFYDADGNIVEFIARQNLKTDSGKPFDPSSFIGISEIGMPSDHIRTTFDRLNEGMKVPVYSGDFDYFIAAGSEHALFILVDQKHKKWFPTRHPAQPCNFNLVVVQDGKEVFLSYQNGLLTFGR